MVVVEVIVAVVRSSSSSISSNSKLIKGYEEIYIVYVHVVRIIMNRHQAQFYESPAVPYILNIQYTCTLM